MTRDREQILTYSEKVLDFISKKQFNDEERAWLAAETLAGLKVNCNLGFLDYSKPVSTFSTTAEQENRGISFPDLHDRNYIDCIGGYGEYNIGQNHPRLIKIIKEHLEQDVLYNWEFLDPLRAMLSRLLAMIAPGDLQNSFFTHSGIESIEGAINLARSYTGRPGIITSVKSNNKTFNSLNTAGRYHNHKNFTLQLPDIQNVPYGDIDELKTVVTRSLNGGHEIAAILLEPILSKEDVAIPPDEYFAQVRDLCIDHGIVLIVDEVQTEMGRTGKLFAIEHCGVNPDILCLGKAFGGGVMPIGAIISTAEIWQTVISNPLMHSNNFGGNPLACAAAIASIKVILDEGLVEQAAEKGNYLLPKLQSMADKYPAFKEARGRGLLIGVEFKDHSTGEKVARELFENGILVARSPENSSVIRIEPALTISIGEIDQLVEVLEKVIYKVSEEINLKGVDYD